jgi:defect-in-organelle-trafficking protein DotB
MDELNHPRIPEKYTPASLHSLLVWAAQNDVSDVYMYPGNRVAVNRYGRVISLGHRELDGSEMMLLINQITSNGGSVAMGGVSYPFRHDENRTEDRKTFRFRGNATASLRGVCAVFRPIPDLPPKLGLYGALDEDGKPFYGVEPELLEFLFPKKGMLVVAGATGSGKSTFLSAVLRRRLETEYISMLTVEAPIEFNFYGIPNALGIVAQTEVPIHLGEFRLGVRDSLRRAPQVILIGEMRDPETVDGAITEVRTGHAVYSTVHTESVAGVIDRMIREFPPSQWEASRMALVDSMAVMVNQSLYPSTDGKRLALREWLVLDAPMKEELNLIPLNELTVRLNHLVHERGRHLSMSAYMALKEKKITRSVYREVLATRGMKE